MLVSSLVKPIKLSQILLTREDVFINSCRWSCMVNIFISLITFYLCWCERLLRLSIPPPPNKSYVVLFSTVVLHIFINKNCVTSDQTSNSDQIKLLHRLFRQRWIVLNLVCKRSGKWYNSKLMEFFFVGFCC